MSRCYQSQHSPLDVATADLRLAACPLLQSRTEHIHIQIQDGVFFSFGGNFSNAAVNVSIFSEHFKKPWTVEAVQRTLACPQRCRAEGGRQLHQCSALCKYGIVIALSDSGASSLPACSTQPAQATECTHIRCCTAMIQHSVRHSTKVAHPSERCTFAPAGDGHSSSEADR